MLNSQNHSRKYAIKYPLNVTKDLVPKAPSSSLVADSKIEIGKPNTPNVLASFSKLFILYTISYLCFGFPCKFTLSLRFIRILILKEDTYFQIFYQGPVFKCRNVDSMQSRWHSFPPPFNDGGLNLDCKETTFWHLKTGPRKIRLLWSTLKIILICGMQEIVNNKIKCFS